MSNWREDAPPLYDYQREGVAWMSVRGAYLLADEMGLGKTCQALRDFDILRNRMPAARLLVVAPNLALDTWAEQVEFWTTFTCAVVTGTPKQRAAALAAEADVTVIAYDNLARELATLNKTGFEYVLFDEAHYIKNPKSGRTKAAFSLRTMKRGLMTGTPIMNRVDELWAPLFVIDPVRFHNYWTFINKFCVFGGWQNKQIIGAQNVAELRSILAPVMLRRLKSEVVKDMPPKTYVKRSCELSKYQRDVYNMARDELRIELESPESIDNPLTKLLRLKQIIGTPACLGGKDDSAKLDLCMEVVSEIGDAKTVIFTQFLGVARALDARLTKAGVSHRMYTGDQKPIDRTAARLAFQTEDEPQVLVCTYGVTKEGVTLNAGTHAIMVDKLYVPALQLQAEDRLHRARKDNVTIIELIAKQTVEQRIEKLLASKRAVFDSVISEDAYESALRTDDLKELLRD